MMEPRQALDELRSIQAQLVRGEQVHCYRWMTTGISGCIGLAASVLQSYFVGHDGEGLSESTIGLEFFWYWLLVALICMTVVGSEMFWRFRHSSAYARQQTTAAVWDFVPCVVVAASISFLFVIEQSAHLKLLPGLWAAFFSLGIFASRRRLPESMVWVAIWYFAIALLVFSVGESFAAWKMAVSFGIGQILMAFVLFQSQTRGEEDK